MSDPLYFAYGSNLATRQMRARCPSAVTVARAVLGAWRLEFVQPHEGWGGGVAGIVEAEDARVPGVVYRLSAADLSRLDGFEPTATARYRRMRVTVRCEDGADLGCWTYVGDVFPQAPYAPSARYLETILEGAREHGLDPAHVEALARLHPGGS